MNIKSQNIEQQEGDNKEIGVLGPDVEFEGDIVFTGTLRLDGKVKGDISPEKNQPTMLIISKTATVQGNVKAELVLVSGVVEGQIEAPKMLEIYRQGRVIGNVKVGGIMVEVGGVLQGRCQMEPVAHAAPALLSKGKRDTKDNHTLAANQSQNGLSPESKVPIKESSQTRKIPNEVTVAD